MFKSIFKKNQGRTNDNVQIKLDQGKLSVQVERNLKGKELEKEGKVEEAKKLYLLNVEEDFDGNHPYDRLAVMYRKEKDYESEIKVLEKAIYVFENKVSTVRADRDVKLERFHNRLNHVYKLKANREEKKG